MPMNCEGKYGYLFMQDLKLPATHEKVQAAYKTFGERVHWVDGNNIPGAFQMNTSWWYKPNREQTLANPNSPVAKPHFHEYPEILGFYDGLPAAQHPALPADHQPRRPAHLPLQRGHERHLYLPRRRRGLPRRVRPRSCQKRIAARNGLDGKANIRL